MIYKQEVEIDSVNVLFKRVSTPYGSPWTVPNKVCKPQSVKKFTQPVLADFLQIINDKRCYIGRLRY